MPKTALELSGTVDYYAGGLCDVGPRVGGLDVIAQIAERWPYRHGGGTPAVKVFLGVEPIATGPVWAIHGFGGTDVTPYECPEITVGGIDLLNRLEALDGREVLLIVEDA